MPLAFISGRRWAGFAFTIGFLAIIGALLFEHLAGLTPCELCLEQRQPYYWGLPILFVIVFLWRSVPPLGRNVMVIGVISMLLWGAFLGSYHAGIEWGFWPGPTACSGGGAPISIESIQKMETVTQCDFPQFVFMGLSLAGYNVLVSIVMVVLLVVAMIRRF